MMHLRQNSDFREIARYPGQGVINPMQPNLAPDANYFMGMALHTVKPASLLVSP